MIEELTIITGSPKKAAAQAQEFLNAHPNAQILGTALTIKRGVRLPPKEAETAKDSKAKDAVETDLPFVAITLGHVFA